MELTLKLWAVIFAVGAINYVSRLSFIAFFARRSMPPLLARALKFVPAAMLSALVLPMVVEPTAGGFAFLSPKVGAAILATVVAYFTRSTLKTLGVGMASLYLLQWLIN